MTFTPAIRFGLCLLALRLGHAGLSASAAPAPASAHALTVTTPAGLRVGSDGAYQIDLGTLDPVQTATVSRTFTIRNTAAAPVVIKELRGSCGCETLLLSRNGVRAAGLSLGAGEQAEIHLTIKLSRFSSGLARKYVWAYGPAGPDAPLLTLALDMRLQPSLTFDPPDVDFGAVTAGQPATQMLTLRLGPDQTATPPALVSTNPAVTVRSADPPGTPAGQKTYALSLSPDAPPGPISGDVHFAGGGTAWPLAAALLGTVRSTLAATPAAAFFGSCPWGTAPSRTVVLTLPPGGPADLTASADQPWLAVRLAPPAAGDRHRLLTITLDKDTPPGGLQATVTIARGLRETLKIPVVAELTKP